MAIEHETLEETLVRLLKEKNMTVTTVESCTGGMLAARITNVSGASAVFHQGFITYSNESKHKLLHVKQETLKNHGAVSAETAAEMAKNGASLTGSHLCISITGIAGPTGGSQEKPVGLVYMACCDHRRVIAKEFHFQGKRHEIREHCIMQALSLLQTCILTDAG